MKISQKGIQLIRRFEGLSLSVYEDLAGHPTVGYGHKLRDSDGLTINSQISLDDAELLLLGDIKPVEAALNKLLPDLTQCQFDSLVSFIFNIGLGSFLKSTMYRLLKAGEIDQAAEQFQRWNKAGGEVRNGLVKRRKAEYNLFVGG